MHRFTYSTVFEWKISILIKLSSFLTEHFTNVIKRAREEPVKKYTVPQTEAQVIGWINKLLVSNDVMTSDHCFTMFNEEVNSNVQ